MIRLILYHLFETYFRHRWLYLIPILLMLAAAGVSIYITKPKFLSQGVMYVQRQSFLAQLNSVRSNDATWWSTPATTANNEISELLRTDAFIRAVIHKTDLEKKMDQGQEVVQETITQTRESIWTMPLGENQLQINCSFEDPNVSYQVVNAVIDAYIQWQVNAQRTESEAAQIFFADQIKLYQATLERTRTDLRNFLEKHPAPLQGDRSDVEQLEITRLQNDMALAENRYVSALEKEENARLALAQIESDTRQSFTIIDAPKLPEKSQTSRRDLALQIAIFLAVGVILSIGCVVGGMALDRTFYSEMDVVQSLNLPVLSVVPETGESTKRRGWLWKKKGERAGKAGKKDKSEPSPVENTPADGVNMSPVAQSVELEKDITV